MKKFPEINGFDLKATDNTANMEVTVALLVRLRLEGEGMTWTEMQKLYEASDYHKVLPFHRAYKVATVEAKKKGALSRLAKKEAAKAAPVVEASAPVEAPKPGSVKAREEKLQAQIAESKAKQPAPVEIVAQGEVVAEEIPLNLTLTVESFFGVSGEKAELLRALMKNDLALGDKSIILAEIAKKAGLSNS